MTTEFLDYLILLENTLASFYEKIRKYPELERYNAVLEFMETHSYAHAEQIKEAGEAHKKPILDENVILNYQNNLTQDVMERIKKEKDLFKVFTILADSEESLGILYKSISDHMLKIADHYRQLSEIIGKISKEEYNHRDLLLKDRDGLKKR